MNIKLLFQSLAKFLSGFLLTSALIFLPAGTFSFANAWLFITVLFVPMLVYGFVMMLANPVLLKKRLTMKETEPQQRLVISLSALMFISGFALAGLGKRFAWYILPFGASLAACIVFIGGYILFARVLCENEYASRSVEIQRGQKLISTASYSVVRHPMYSASLIMFLSMPIILGSLYSLLIFFTYPFIIALRIKNEEALLEKELPGYVEYKNKVRYRLIPYVW